jgi:uncharacterized protein (DUF2336 family)
LGGAAKVGDIKGSLDTAVFDAVIEHGTAEERRDLALQLAALLGEPDVTRADRAAAVPAVVALTADPVREIRAELSAALAEHAFLEAEILFSIIAADDDIAVGFIATTQALDRSRMLSILKVGDEARQCALAGRPDLPPDIVAALIESASEAAVATLIDNGFVSLRPSDFKLIYLRYANTPTMVNRLLDVDELPAEIRLLEVRRAAQRMHHLVRQRRWMPSSEAEATINETEERTLLRILLAVEGDALERLISFMSSRDMLTPSIMLRAACGGHMMIVEQALAWLAAMPLKRLKGLGAARNGQSLKALHASAGIPDDCFPVMRAAFAVAADAESESEWPSEEQFGRRVIETILTRHEGLAPQQSAMMLDLVGQFADDRTRALANRLKGSLTAVA